MMNFLKRIRYGQTFQNIINEIEDLATDESAFAWHITKPFNGTTCTVQLFKVSDEIDIMETWMIVAAFDGTLHTIDISGEAE